MIKTRFLSVIGGMLLSVAAIDHVGAADACASSDGVWNGAGGQWNLYQSSNGNITGTMINDGSDSGVNGCTANHLWTVTGHHNNDGSYSYQAVFTAPLPRPEQCAQSITYQGEILKPGCSMSGGTWTNSGGRFGTFGLFTSCRIPQETVPQFVKWGDGSNTPYPYDQHSQAAAKWTQNLTPTSFNYGGRYVRELFLNDGVDTCHFPGSAITPLTQIPPKKLDIRNQLPSSYADYVGLGENTVEYYRSKNISPCGAYLKQRMKIDCENGEIVYQINDLEASQDIWTVSSKRGASERKTRNWGAPTPRVISTINAIINLLLED